MGSKTMQVSRTRVFLLSALTVLLCSQLSTACHIAGSDNGVCMDPVEFEDDMPFCRSVVRYPACVPLQNTGIESQSVAGKDKWVRDKVTSVISERIRLENNDRLRDQGINEHGHDVEIKKRFDGNSDCQNSYKNYMCYLNFPRCDQEGRSLILCRTVCENYFKSCKVSTCTTRAPISRFNTENTAITVWLGHEKVRRPQVFRSRRS
eukprot:gb/GECG01009415.1/.p1 GENE.gb/GECG01009415.1/~~gb/GECG01009415.1/.p1  ORF type:complete len:206 (+),score=7.12 gb/GECG01009415.1/:1-618(+)